MRKCKVITCNNLILSVSLKKSFMCTFQLLSAKMNSIIMMLKFSKKRQTIGDSEEAAIN